MKIPTIFLLLVGCVWALFVMWMFLTFAGIMDFAWSLSGVLYWILMLTGPVMLIVGSYLVLIGAPGRSGILLVALACLMLTGWVIYQTCVAMLQRLPLQAPPNYSFYLVMLVITLLADVAVFRVVAQRRSLRVAYQ